MIIKAQIVRRIIFQQPVQGLPSLIDLKDIVLSSDISSFEVNHSGMVDALLMYLTRLDEQFAEVDRNQRLRNFIHVFASCPVSWILMISCSRESSRIKSQNVYLQLDQDVPQNNQDVTAFSALVHKLNCCISQLEQFPVKVHDLPAGAGSTTALKFFNTHQLKVRLWKLFSIHEFLSGLFEKPTSWFGKCSHLYKLRKSSAYSHNFVCSILFRFSFSIFRLESRHFLFFPHWFRVTNF